MYTKILLATDGSECSLKAAHAAAEIASRCGGSITILNLFYTPPEADPYGGLPYYLFATPEAIAESQEAAVCGARSIVKHAGVPCVVRLEVGPPAAEIARLAEEEKADLIVIGSRGLGPFKALLMGSVSDRVVHLAHCPVLIVR